MRLAEMLEKAKESGYGLLWDGRREWELDEFAHTFRGDRGDWSFTEDGQIIEHRIDGGVGRAPWLLQKTHCQVCGVRLTQNNRTSWCDEETEELVTDGCYDCHHQYENHLYAITYGHEE